MSSNLMDTSPGGESTQYESIKTVTKPHSKEGGQLSDKSTTSAPSNSNVSSSRGEQTAENVRYGQAISEQGVGGFTAPEHNSGEAKTESGFGGEDRLEGEEEMGKMRREQGYGAGEDMDRNIGA